MRKILKVVGKFFIIIGLLGPIFLILGKLLTGEASLEILAGLSFLYVFYGLPLIALGIILILIYKKPPYIMNLWKKIKKIGPADLSNRKRIAALFITIIGGFILSIVSLELYILYDALGSKNGPDLLFFILFLIIITLATFSIGMPTFMLGVFILKIRWKACLKILLFLHLLLIMGIIIISVFD